MNAVLIVCFNFFVATSAVNENTYRAAVVAYTPILTAEEPLTRLYENVDQYIKYIGEAGQQKCDIIIFPEDGLTGWYDVITYKEYVNLYSTQVPDPLTNVTPCASDSDIYSKALKRFSCSALKNKIYVVVNLVEKVCTDTNKECIYYNTNVVFDRNGAIVARYRKINLLNEVLFYAGTDISKFKTDFGVTFGIYTCFDISFRHPALTILADPEVTDIVFPVAWFSHLPFIQGLSIHHGYTTSTGVNLLAAGLHDPASRNGGAAIYLAGGKISKVYLTEKEGSQLIISDVPIVANRKPPRPCQLVDISPSSNVEKLEDINGFITSTEDLTNYTFKAVDFSQSQIHETICSGDKFCCTFDVSLALDKKSNYVYMMVAYHGTVQLSLVDRLGTRVCGVVACKDESITSCGRRHSTPPEGAIFESIEVKGVFDDKDSHDQPSTLKHNLKPVSNYKFCKNEVNDNKVEVSISTDKKQDALLTFGIYGRVYKNDGAPVGVIDL